MIENILLLADPALIDGLETVLHDANPRLAVDRVHTLARLDTLCRDGAKLGATRLISVGSDIIVPGSILARLGGVAYNFHPGPPTHPGRFPSCFFIYDGGTRFGTTVHEMAAKVDSGAIVATDWFDVPADPDRLTLDGLSFRSLIRLFRQLAPHLANRPDPLPHIGQTWSGRVTTQRDFDALCRLPNPVSEAEFLRRHRAVGEGPDHALEITLHGHRFQLSTARPDPQVTIGGTPRR